MTNTNCLEGIKCPACGNEESFRIAGTAIFTVTDDGTEDHGDIEWNDDSYAECTQCYRHGTLKDFTAAGAATARRQP
jgi:sarcosine oxidase delta subunit